MEFEVTHSFTLTNNENHGDFPMRIKKTSNFIMWFIMKLLMVTVNKKIIIHGSRGTQCGQSVVYF